jgi:hypothetical protein
MKHCADTIATSTHDVRSHSWTTATSVDIAQAAQAAEFGLETRHLDVKASKLPGCGRAG